MLMKRICATIEFLTRRDKRDQNLFPTEEYLVLYVLPDSYVDPEYKDYGGELFLNGEVIPRTPVWTPERQRRIVRFMTPILRYNVRTRNVRGRESMH